MTRAIRGGVLVLFGVVLSGCTSESTRIALEAQRRADEVQQAVFDRQHDALRVLLYRDALQRLENAGLSMSPERRDALSEIWNERDLVEFWAVQYERAVALRMIGVDAKLYGDQAVLDLLWKAIETRTDRARRGLLVEAVQDAVESADAGGGETR